MRKTYHSDNQYYYTQKWNKGVCLQNTFDYSPFGAALDGRTMQGDAYRYGFNGHEKCDEVKGSVNHLLFGDYGYDPRTGRRWNIDPKTKKYPDLSPYATFNNNPIFFTDPNGQEPIKPSATSLSGLIKVLNSKNVESLADLISWYGGIEPPGPNDNVKSNGWLTERYVYSKSWGWIDMRHFSAAAYGTDLLLASSDDILENGERTEAGQEQAGYPSAWSYEDLVSNALGVYFESYLDDYNGTTLEALESFFKDIVVVENPLEAAPNKIPEKERTSPSKNTTYNPKYATHLREKGLNAKIVKFIEEFTGEDISKDRRNKVIDENGKPKGSN